MNVYAGKLAKNLLIDNIKLLKLTKQIVIFLRKTTKIKININTLKLNLTY